MAANSMRRPILIDSRWLPFMLPFGTRRSRSYLEVSENTLDLVFAPFFRESVPRDRIAAVRPCSWPHFGGIGWRVGRGGTVGLIGSRKNTVEVLLREPQRVRLAFLPMNCRRIVVSVQDPAAFIADLGARALASSRRHLADRDAGPGPPSPAE
ncbi:MAG TPA: hypothetical protein VII83_06795 [Gaiellaceae bacterium]